MPLIRKRSRGRRARRREHARAVRAVGAAVVILAIAGAAWLVARPDAASSAVRGGAAATVRHHAGADKTSPDATLAAANAVVLSDEHGIATLAVHQVTQQDLIDLLGLEQSCASDVAAYNGDARSADAGRRLPATLPSAYPATVCEPPSSSPTP